MHFPDGVCLYLWTSIVDRFITISMCVGHVLTLHHIVISVHCDPYECLSWKRSGKTRHTGVRTKTFGKSVSLPLFCLECDGNLVWIKLSEQWKVLEWHLSLKSRGQRKSQGMCWKLLHSWWPQIYRYKHGVRYQPGSQSKPRARKKGSQTLHTQQDRYICLLSRPWPNIQSSIPSRSELWN